MSTNEKKLVVVYRSSGEPRALVIKGLLESFGIPCILKSEAVGTVYGITADGLGEVKVLVAEADAEKARELIQ
jgi:hypothetical protein